MARILLSINAGWNVVNFRGGLVRALVADGHDVIAAVPDDGSMEAIAALGAEPVALPMAASSVSPAGDLALFARYRRLIAVRRPHVYLGWTIKPNTYGSAAAALARVPRINNISGLGTAFIRRSWLTHVARALYRVGLAGSSTVFFQNEDDRAEFVGAKLVKPVQVRLLNGSGLDLDHFAPQPAHHRAPGDVRFLLIARLVRDKGVYEYVEAARAVKARHPGARFALLGFLDVDNRTAISRAEVDAWVAEGVVDYLGASDDVRPHVAAADCIVLPSYREGTSRVLLEAGAMARPAVTCDVPGCNNVVTNGETGFLARVRDAADLARAIERVIALGAEGRALMGRAAHARIATHFSEASVIAAYRDAIARALVGRDGAAPPLPPADAASRGGGEVNLRTAA
jgi:glycosyltransferase involved in cell wall biosynthesis